MYGILVDVTKCTACEKCVAACVERNKKCSVQIASCGLHTMG